VGENLNLSNLKPAGRGLGSGKGRYSGRGIKGQKARSGSAKMRAGFEGGQMPLYMRVPKQRGATSADAMPIGPFRTYTQPVNVSALGRFEAGTEVTPELLKQAGLIRTTRKDVKVLGNGELATALTVVAHAVSAAAREKIEAAGGTVALLREPKPKKAKKARPRPVASEDAEPDETSAEDDEPAAEPEPDS
jgi:large subunit ribosomal protein L15